MSKQKEIEYRYLVDEKKVPFNSAFNVQTAHIGYFIADSKLQARVAITTNREFAMLNFKGPRSGATRDEFEYDIPKKEGLALYQLARHHVIKTRYKLPVIGNPGYYWAVDVYHEDNAGLIVAELEVNKPDDIHYINKPDWITHDITELDFMYNRFIANVPWALNKKKYIEMLKERGIEIQ